MLKSIINLSLVILMTTGLCSKAHDLKSYNLIQNKDMTVFYYDAEMFGLFDSARYDEEKSRLEFKTSDEIQMIQIFNQNLELEFVLPVDSKSVILQKSLFDQGHNRLGFMVEGVTNMKFTEVLIF